MKKLLLFLCIVCSFINNAWPQTLKINDTSTLFASFCDSGSSSNLLFYITYQGSTISGNEYIKISYRINGTTYKLPDSATVSSLSNGDIVTIYDTAEILSSNGFSSNKEDIIVIWPTGSGGIPITGDSITDSTYVEDPDDTTSGIPLINGFKMTLYPNPAENLLYLDYNENKINHGQVRIYDLLGQTMLTKTSSFNTIDITALPSGFYFIDAITTDKSRYITSFIKSQ